MSSRDLSIVIIYTHFTMKLTVWTVNFMGDIYITPFSMDLKLKSTIEEEKKKEHGSIERLRVMSISEILLRRDSRFIFHF